MKKALETIFIALIFITMALPFTSCRLFEIVQEKYIGANEAREAETKELMNSFDNKDAERLKGMFCKTTAVSPDIDKQIQNGINFIHGKIISHGSVLGGSSESWSHGKKTLLSISSY